MDTTKLEELSDDVAALRNQVHALRVEIEQLRAEVAMLKRPAVFERVELPPHSIPAHNPFARPSRLTSPFLDDPARVHSPFLGGPNFASPHPFKH